MQVRRCVRLGLMMLFGIKNRKHLGRKQRPSSCLLHLKLFREERHLREEQQGKVLHMRDHLLLHIEAVELGAFLTPAFTSDEQYLAEFQGTTWNMKWTGVNFPKRWWIHYSYSSR